MHAEYQEHQEIQGASDRSFGLTVGGILLLIEAYRLYSSGEVDMIGVVLLCISIPLLVLGLIYPRILAPLNKAWLKLGSIMFRVVNPVIMFFVYALTVVPIGLILKLSGKDLLNIKLDKSIKSYWVERDPAGPSPESMKNQF